MTKIRLTFAAVPRTNPTHAAAPARRGFTSFLSSGFSGGGFSGGGFSGGGGGGGGGGSW